MNQFLSDQWIERVERLALGLEPIDAGRGTRLAHPLRIVGIGGSKAAPSLRVTRHSSCRQVLLYERGVKGRIVLRFFEPVRSVAGGPFDVARRIVPRAISFPILDEKGIDGTDRRRRFRRPHLFPGAGYDLAAGMTGMRGRVERAGKPVRWARVFATRVGMPRVIGRAHGDDRGEFLLLIAPEASNESELTNPLNIHFEIRVPNPATAPQPPKQPGGDPFWDLPVEPAADLIPPDYEADPVSRGDALPPDYIMFTSRNAALVLGEILNVGTLNSP